MGIKSKVLTIMMLLCFLSYFESLQASSPTDSLQYILYYKKNSSEVDSTFRDNSFVLKSMFSSVQELKKENVIRNISIFSRCSPEGSTKLNKALSQQRAANMCSYLQSHFSLPDSLFTPHYLNQDWNELYRRVEKSDMPFQKDVLHILKTTPEWITRNGVVVDGRKHQLMILYKGKPWWYMDNHFFPDLRSSTIIINYEPKYGVAKNENVVLPNNNTSTHNATPVSNDSVASDIESFIIAKDTLPSLPMLITPKTYHLMLKTNLLYDALLIPNIGAEIGLANRWSIGASWTYSWWKSDKLHRYWRIYGGELEVRKYVGRKLALNPFTGHHVGFYLQGLTYDFELGGRGYLSNLTYGAGVEYGYSLPISKRLNIDFGIGAGYLGGEYKEYLPIDDCYVWQATKKRNWYGITKAEISLVWLIGYKNNMAQKGGKK